MDDPTFRLLKKSKYYYPEITEVMFDSQMLFEMVLDSIHIAEKGYDTVWDTIMLNCMWKYFKEGVQLIEKQSRDKGVRLRLIVETTKPGLEIINSLKCHDVRHLDGIKGNFGIFDNRAYMVYIFHKDGEIPDQTLWSNSKALVDKQQAIFERLWEMAMPLSSRIKELEYEENPNYHKTLTDFNQVKDEIASLVENSKKELVIFSSNEMLYAVFQNFDYLKHLPNLLKKGKSVKILTDGVNLDTVRLIKYVNKENMGNPIQFGYTNRLGNIDSLTIISDGKLMVQIKTHDGIRGMVASLSNEKYGIAVQEILFEKYWNEVKSLEASSRS